ncbi:MAG TPA: hypothetical protein VF933_13370, partial [Streptosporangiaceae bacterium]
SATEPEIAGLPGIGPRVASAVLAALRPGPPGDGRPEPPAAEPPADQQGNSAHNGSDIGGRSSDG